MTDSVRHKDLVRHFVGAANGRDYAALKAVLAADFVRHCPATPDVVVETAEAFVAFQQAQAVTFPDNRVDLVHLVAEDDHVAFWAVFTGTQHGPMGPFPPSDRRMSIEFAGIFGVAGGRIASLRLTWDNVGALTQLGHLTAPG